MRIDEIDELLRETARDAYHPPPPTPREAIWAGIEAARAARRESTSQTAETTSTVEAAQPGSESTEEREVPRRRVKPGLTWWGLGIAATIALGTGLERIVERSGDATEATTRPARPTPPTVAETPPPSGDTASGDALATGESANEDRGAAAHGGEVERPATPVRLVEATESPGLAAAPAPRPISESPPESMARGAARSSFRLAALEHLGRAELLLAGFQADARGGSIALGLGAEARELLSATRLLLDSPAAAEPRLEGLLLDLELVLAQLARFPDNPTLDEFELIDQALTENNVITRLRLTVPSGTLLARS